MQLAGKAALISGAGGGICRAIAVALAEAGAAIACCDIDPEASAETARLVTAAGGRALSQACDVASEAQTRAVGPSKDLPVHLAGMALERDLRERHVGFFSELEKIVAAIVEHRNPIERDLIERWTSIELARKCEQRVEKCGALAN